MTDQRGTPAAAEEPDGPFAHAFAHFHRLFDQLKEARRQHDEAQQRQTEAINALPEDQRADMEQLAAIADRLKIQDFGDAVFKLLDPVETAFKEMMRIEAPTPFALALKLQTLNEYDPGEAQYYLDRLIADAGTVSLQPATAWIDRWRALGGSFGLTSYKGKPTTANRGMLVDLDYWKPTDRDHPTLRPHEWLIEEKHHTGAVKVLEGLLTLTPGLQEAVIALVSPTIPGLGEVR